MNFSLLEQFLSEGRDCLQGIGEKLMQLENRPGDAELMTELFRLVHTLKGNSGLFEFPEMTRVLHAGEDLMDAVRNGRMGFSPEIADQLLDAMDFVGMLCDEIERNGSSGTAHISTSARLSESLRKLIVVAPAVVAASAEASSNLVDTEDAAVNPQNSTESVLLPLAEIPEATRMAAYRRLRAGGELFAMIYRPSAECFFQGDDPLHQSMHTPEVLWGRVVATAAWPELALLDAYHCVLQFEMLSAASRLTLDEYYRYMPDAVQIAPVAALSLIVPTGDPNGGPVYEDFVLDALRLLDNQDQAGLLRAADSMLDLSSPDLWFASALRWLLLLIETEPDNLSAQRSVILALRDLQPPVWETEVAALEVVAAVKDVAANVAANVAVDLPELAETAQTAKAADSILSALSPDEQQALSSLVATQKRILSLPVENEWQIGRIRAAIASLTSCVRLTGNQAAMAALEEAVALAEEDKSNAPLLDWIEAVFGKTKAPAIPASAPAPVIAAAKAVPVPQRAPAVRPQVTSEVTRASPVASATAAPVSTPVSSTLPDLPAATAEADSEPRFGRRAEDTTSAPKSLKVDQVKIDRLMNLIGEMVVSKNALPYLAARAETVFGVRELSREIKAQYAVINRIAEEMQDGIMQIRMMPVSSVFQRFPRLVRDISRRLGKDVQLVLEGEETEADKNIIESLGDPLMHIVRNSLDHGFELPAVRVEAGKPAQGTLTIRATQESDRVVIEIIDDGKGIDPQVIKRKAYEKGIIDEAALGRLTDQEAVNLVFAAGFSTVEVISDLSGRGVGMDVVRNAIEKVNGSLQLESEKGKGTRLRLSLPLSMAVTNVMIIESDRQIFGVPMDAVVETVRVPRGDIHTIKQTLAMVLRGRIVPLKSLNKLLGICAPPLANDEDELAVLVVRLGDEVLGLLVDNFRETIDIILKPMTSILAGLPVYSGSALMGDGSVLMVLNVKEIL
jgi:two-component system chemotaxis sensor kinase CheA